MNENNEFLLQEKAARREELLASIARALRERSTPTQPLSERLAELLKEIEQSLRVGLPLQRTL
jgi:hypothetical protein